MLHLGRLFWTIDGTLQHLDHKYSTTIETVDEGCQTVLDCKVELNDCQTFFKTSYWNNPQGTVDYSGNNPWKLDIYNYDKKNLHFLDKKSSRNSG